jgi:hypothetical protein
MAFSRARPRVGSDRSPPRRTTRRVRDPPRVGPHVARYLTLRVGGETRPVLVKLVRLLSISSPMPSRQERRKAERDAAKRAPGQAGTAGGAGNVNPGGDWRSQAENPNVLRRALGVETLRQRAGQGDREAEWSMGYHLVATAGGVGAPLGSAGRSPKADVGLALAPHSFRSLTETRRRGHLMMTK